jgi:hypothetical protein
MVLQDQIEARRDVKVGFGCRVDVCVQGVLVSLAMGSGARRSRLGRVCWCWVLRARQGRDTRLEAGVTLVESHASRRVIRLVAGFALAIIELLANRASEDPQVGVNTTERIKNSS